MPETGALIATFFEGAGEVATVAEGAGAVEAGVGAAEVGTAAAGAAEAGTAAGGAAEVGSAAGFVGEGVASGVGEWDAASFVGAGGTVGGAGATAGAGGSIIQTLGTPLASGVASQLITGLLKPDAAAAPISSAPAKSTAPNVPPPAAMPDPVAQEQARRKSIIEQLARRGRASTILTQPSGSGRLGA